MPRPVLRALGLLGQPAHCQISVPATEAGLLTVTLGDIQNVPISAEVNLRNPSSCNIELSKKILHLPPGFSSSVGPEIGLEI